MGRLGTSSGGGRLGSSGSSSNEGFTEDQLEMLVDRYGLPPMKEKKPLNILDKVSRVLNFGTAVVAGAVKGIKRDDLSLGEGIAEGVRRNIGFADVLKEDFGVNPESRWGKIGLGTAGFLADVVFDPLTYITFGAGAGLKVGGKTLTKAGTKLAQKASTEIIEEQLTKALAKGIAPEVANKVAAKGVKGSVNELLLRTMGKRGLTEEAAEEFLAKGVSDGTISTLRELGPKLIDQGGIKFFGKTLVKSSTLAKTPVGKAAKRLGETEIVTALKNTLGKTFIADFGKNPKLVGIIENAQRAQRRAMAGIVEANSVLFEGLSDDQMSRLFSDIFAKKKAVIQDASIIQRDTIQQINALFPDLKVKTPEDAARVLNDLEDNTIEKITKLRENVDDIVKEHFATRQARIAANEGRELAGDAGEAIVKTPTVKSLAGVDELSAMERKLRAQLAELRKGRAGKQAAKQLEDGKVLPEITRDEMVNVSNRLIAYEEERLTKVVDDLSKKIEDLKKKPAGAPTKAGKAAPKAANTAAEIIVLTERQIDNLQKELVEKERMLGKVLDARKIAKKGQKAERLLYPDDERLQAVSDALFEGDKAIIKKFAKLAGLSEEDAIKFYIPSLFEDKLKVKDFAFGRNLSSPQMGFLKEFTGIETDELIKDPFEAYARGQVAVATARIKGDAFKATVQGLGRPLTEFTESEAARLGFVKVARQTVDGEVAGWLPKEVADEVNRFLNPNTTGTIDELAKNTGFDYVTGLFKGYVTALFPGFHIRNITSNQFQNMLKIGLDTANPRVQHAALEIALDRTPEAIFKTKIGRDYTFGEIHKLVRKHSDLLDSRSTAFGSMEMLLEAGEEKIQRMENFSLLNPNTWKKTLNPLSQEFGPMKAGRAFGGAAEAQAKMVAILSALNDGKTIQEGIKLADEAIFNYAKLTDMERSIFRRLIPFYTFARKNAEYQVKMLMTNPGRVAAELKAIRGVSNAVGDGSITEEDKAGLPNWIIDSLGIKAGANEYGQQRFLIGFGLPIEEFLQRFSGEQGIVWNTVQNILTQANPIIKMPLERATGKEFFRDRPIEEITNAEDLKALFDVLPKGVSKELQDLIEFREIPDQPVYADGKVVARKSKFVANPYVLHWLRNLPTSRLQSTAGFLTDEGETSSGKALKLLTGIKGYSIDQEYQKFQKELERKRELEDYLIRMGVLKRFERAYQPKSSETNYRKERR